jgi:glycerol-3-phosphate acyltransferase PlsY
VKKGGIDVKGLIAGIVLAYLLGSMNWSYISGRLFGGIDIREHGSGNAGATNVYRTLGVKPMVLALLGDFAKGIASVFLGRHMSAETGAILAAVAVVCGHNWPVFLRFKGGKGIATSLGVLFGLDYRIATMLLIIGIMIIILTKYVSVASITCAALYPLFTLLSGASTEMLIFSVVIAFFAIVRHRKNIVRLVRGEESKLTIKRIPKRRVK